MAKNENLHKAKTAKNDEFYTQLSDIEKEMVHYKQHFNGKTVYCNCDDARESNFFKYFSKNFEFLGLKKLITTGYKADGKGVALIYEGDKNGNHNPDSEEITIKPLQGNGDFRSAECVEFLKEADIVVTNPPFSLFRQYIAQLMEYGKKFLVIGNTQAITYKEVFPYIKANELWLGVSSFNSGMYFVVPENYQYAATYKFDRERNGNKVMRVASICWFTNMPHEKRNRPIDLYKHYSNEYKHYDNYDAIEVGKVCEIPMDYDGVMGVPITFLDKYCPEQFEILGLMSGAKDDTLLNGNDGRAKWYINGKGVYARILIRHRK